MIPSGKILGRLLGPLLKTGLSLMKNGIKPLAKSVSIPLGLTAAAAAADTGIHKKISGSGTTTLIISNDEMKDIIKIVKSLENSGLLLKGVSKTIQNDAKEQKRGFLSMLLNEQSRRRIYQSWLWTFNEKQEFLIPPHPLTNFKTQKYHQHEPRFNGVYSRDHLPDEIEDGICVIILEEYSDIGTHWIALYALINITYFDSFGIEHIPKEIKIFIDKSIVGTNILEYKHMIH